MKIEDYEKLEGKQFYRTSKSYYYRKSDKVEVFFGRYNDEYNGEMRMTWRELGKKFVPQLQVFDDGWKALNSFPDLLQKMAEVNNKCITEKGFVEILLSCGFRDNTQYENPYPPEDKKFKLQNELKELENESKQIDNKLKKIRRELNK